jgi:hypothetical protein
MNSQSNVLEDLVAQFKLNENGTAHHALPVPGKAALRPFAIPERLHYPLSS